METMSRSSLLPLEVVMNLKKSQEWLRHDKGCISIIRSPKKQVKFYGPRLFKTTAIRGE